MKQFLRILLAFLVGVPLGVILWAYFMYLLGLV